MTTTMTQPVATSGLMTPAEAWANAGSLDLVDVRTPAEFRAVHAVPARNVPLSDLDPAAVWAGRTAGRRLVLVCKSGKRAATARELMAKSGHTDVVVLEGGTDAWVAAALPVVRDKGAISIDRQVRLIAGGLVAAGVVLSAVVSPWWLVLPGVIGTGLFVSGATDTCAMGTVLGRCPWNR